MELIEFYRHQIANYKKPTSVYFFESFPLNAFGKVNKCVLVKMAIERAVEIAQSLVNG